MFWTEESIAFLRDAAAMNRYYCLLYTSDAADE